ncbi:hypothetical protein [Dehalobacter sp.]|uniref:hypothetical protein n=1 Tax=Dehalobacter sp. TaxID=1962289 RepID=UPI002588D974|nr:hypothetical protein [Dehalobacter sp.]MDJ0304753.1 hypothetical protein [Dehalobacter sp.]
MSKNDTALTIKTGFMNLADFNMNDAMAEELDGLEGGFERIKIPSAGSTVYEVPGENPNEPDTVKEFSAVILFHHPLHAYYQSKYTGGNQPPDCGSFDGLNGEGNPGGSCSACYFNKFGSGENGSKACKNRRRIYVLREGEIFPLLISIPTGSLKEFTRFIKRLLSKGKKSNSVVTKFSLKKATNNGGIAYSQAQFSVDRVLTPDEFTLINKLSEQVKLYSKNIGFEMEHAVEAADDLPFVDAETGEIVEPLK